MSDNNTDTTEVTDEGTTPEGVVEQTTEAGETEPQSKREARYRTQLREAEAERDTLTARVEALQRAEVERLASDLIEKPAALWTAGVDLADLTDDDGAIDPDKVTDAVKAAQSDLGLQGSQKALRAGPVVPLEGTSTHRGSSGTDPWKSAFEG